VKALEEEMVSPFQDPDPSKFWREGCNKSCFNYLLLDPRVTQNLPARAKTLGIFALFQVNMLALNCLAR
jgi:hypothetical protein